VVDATGATVEPRSERFAREEADATRARPRQVDPPDPVGLTLADAKRSVEWL
jgi:hypothetical protein